MGNSCSWALLLHLVHEVQGSVNKKVKKKQNNKRLVKSGSGIFIVRFPSFQRKYFQHLFIFTTTVTVKCTVPLKDLLCGVGSVVLTTAAHTPDSGMFKSRVITSLKEIPSHCDQVN